MAEAKQAEYRFSRSDFGPLVLAPLHYDLLFDVRGDRVRVQSLQTYRYTGAEPTTTCELNAHDLEIHAVQLCATHSPLGPPPVGIDAVVPDFVAHVASIGGAADAAYEFDEAARKLRVALPAPIQRGDEIVIRTESTCRPDDKVLEGIYFDYSPEGAPQTMITQCQQYGFQRIVPCVDRMASKTFYTTTIVASTRYSSLVSNGDLAPAYADAHGDPVYRTPEQALTDAQKAFLAASPPSSDGDAPRHVLVYHNHKVNMAPYLFFLGMGSYDVYKRGVEYPDGVSCSLELLCLPGIVEPLHAAASLKALHDSILWLFLDGGPEKYDHVDERKRIYALIEEREALKGKVSPLVRSKVWRGAGGEDEVAAVASAAAASSATPEDTARLAAVRAELAELISAWSETGYRYTGSVYREIAMENSNYGGMENVGNTTIISSRLTPSAWLVDGGYLYMEGVKIHEFYHNINGSQVTGASPFEIWLNEAVTVHVQREREDALFGKDYMRLRKVIYAFQPATGPLAMDRSPTSMAIEPRGFNTTHELISAMTYSKAPAFVRMVQSILGKKPFVRALENYHRKFAFSNATTADWIACMAEQAPEGVDLPDMAEGWLRRTGYPTLTVESVTHDAAAQTLTLQISQSGFEAHDGDETPEKPGPWTIPLDWCLVTGGAVTHEGMQMFDVASGPVVISGVGAAPDFVSLARQWSFFGDVKFAPGVMTPQQRVLQAMTDPDAVNRYLAYAGLADAEKANLILIDTFSQRNGGAECKAVREVGADFVALYARVLTDAALSPATKALFLNVSESIPSRADLGHWYTEIAVARKDILRAVFDAHGPAVYAVYRKLLAASHAKQGAPQIAGLMERPLLFVCYSVLVAGAFGRQHGHASLVAEMDLLADLKSLLSSTAMSERFFALRAVLEAPDDVADAATKAAIQAAAKAEWKEHPIGCEQYVQCIAYVDCDDSVKYLRELVSEPFFNMALAGHSRTVARGWTSNRKRCLLTDDGLALTEELFLKIGSVNQMSAYSFLSAFGDLRKFDAAQQARLTAALERMKAAAKDLESLSNQLAILLKK